MTGGLGSQPAGGLDAVEVPRLEVAGLSKQFEAVQALKHPLLEKAFLAFEGDADAMARGSFDAFCAEAAHWLDDFALFMALKAENGGRAWPRWAWPAT